QPIPIHSHGRAAMCFQRARPSPASLSPAAALNASWPPVSSTTLSSHKMATSGEMPPVGMSGRDALGDVGRGDAVEERGGALDQGAAFLVDRDHVVAVVQQQQ